MAEMQRVDPFPAEPAVTLQRCASTPLPPGMPPSSPPPAAAAPAVTVTATKQDADGRHVVLMEVAVASSERSSQQPTPVRNLGPGGPRASRGSATLSKKNANMQLSGHSLRATQNFETVPVVQELQRAQSGEVVVLGGMAAGTITVDMPARDADVVRLYSALEAGLSGRDDSELAPIVELAPPSSKLYPGDRILVVNGTDVRHDLALARRLLREAALGTVTITLQRGERDNNAENGNDRCCGTCCEFIKGVTMF